MRTVEAQHSIHLPDYNAVYDWSIREPAQFWAALWEFLGIVGERGNEVVSDSSGSILNTRFFPNARLNFAENLLRRKDHCTALIALSESGRRRSVSCRELYDLVSRTAQALRNIGISEGDRVVGVLPNIPETVVCMLATNTIGGIWSSCSPDLGTEGLWDRIGQISPKVVVGTDSYVYKGKHHETLNRLIDLVSRLGEATELVIVSDESDQNTRECPRFTRFTDFLAPFGAEEIQFRQGSFDQPAFIVYSSGTTGKPKAILHGAGRVLVQLLKEHALHFDTQEGDRFQFYTTAGWNVWYTLVSALGVGGVVVLYDGSPFFPVEVALFDVMDNEAVAIMGTSPRYLETLHRRSVCPANTHKLLSLRTIISSGAPLNADSYDYVYECIGSDIQLSSASGGTEIMTTFANGNPIGPVWRGELQARTLGMKVEIFDDGGRSVREKKGELVCTAPFPSTPLGFWGDPTGERYRDTYFGRYNDVWWHGDFAEITARDGMVIYGRSDATLNPGGVRIGTGEIYRPLEKITEIDDSIVVDQEWQGDKRIVLFVKLKAGHILDDSLKQIIQDRIGSYATHRHVPSKIIQVEEIPYTVNSKKVELTVRRLIHGEDVKGSTSLMNPEALDQFRDVPELRR